jgi:hypothetical protein
MLPQQAVVLPEAVAALEAVAGVLEAGAVTAAVVLEPLAAVFAAVAVPLEVVAALLEAGAVLVAVTVFVVVVLVVAGCCRSRAPWAPRVAAGSQEVR